MINPINFIKSKKQIRNERLMAQYLTSFELNKRTMYKIFLYLFPIIYMYSFLILVQSTELYGTRLFFYAPVVLIIGYMYRFNVKYQMKLIDVAQDRELKETIKGK